MLNKDTYADVSPAPYALPKGVPALQADPMRTRRCLLASAATALGIGAVGALFATRQSPAAASDSTRTKRLEWARRCAKGPESVLHEKADMFLSVVELYGGDEVIWGGVERIVRRASEVPSDNPAWGERVLAALDACRTELPAQLSEPRMQLERQLRMGAASGR